MLMCVSHGCKRADSPMALFSSKEVGEGGCSSKSGQLTLTPFKELSQKHHPEFPTYISFVRTVLQERPGKILFL